MQGPYRLRWADGDLMMFVEGPKVSKPFFVSEENKAIDFRNMLNEVFLTGYSTGYTDGSEKDV